MASRSSKPFLKFSFGPIPSGSYTIATSPGPSSPYGTSTPQPTLTPPSSCRHSTTTSPGPSESCYPLNMPPVPIDIETSPAPEYPRSIEGLLRPLEEYERQVQERVKENLSQRRTGKWTDSDDDLFACFTDYVADSFANGVAQRPIALWEQHICPCVASAEEASVIRIHKGSPLYNVGLCCFCLGHCDRAYQYFAEAGKEDELCGRGDRRKLLVGDGLSEQVLIAPLVPFVVHWAKDYRDTTNSCLDKDELKRVIAWLTLHARADAMQLVIALHRLFAVKTGPQNDASEHLGVQAVADLVVVVESSLRHWQKTATGQLHSRIRGHGGLIHRCRSLEHGFDRFQSAFTCEKSAEHVKGNPGWMETADAVNWCIEECERQISQAANGGERAGACCFLAVRLRNSLTHVIEERLSLRSDTTVRSRVAGRMLAVIRLSQHGEEGSLAGLP